MKKLVVFCVFAALIAGSAFGFIGEVDFNNTRHSAQGEISLLGGGLRYEATLNPNFSLVGFFYYNNLFLFLGNFSVGVGARYFPTSGIFESGMFFVELGIGYSFNAGTGTYTHSYIDWDGEPRTDTYYDTWMETRGVGIIPAAGWKIDVGQEGGFYLQPGLRLPLTIGNKRPRWGGWYGTPDRGRFGVGFHVVAYLGMGYAF